MRHYWISKATFSGIVLASWAFAAFAAPAIELGVLTPFYRSTQVQGHIEGDRFLMEIPGYLLAPEVDVAYHRKPGFKKEIPFVDSFTINRFLGGYRREWLEQYGYCSGHDCPTDYDYAFRKPDGSLGFRPELVAWHLKSYLDAGYRLGDITINIENVPWSLARNGGDLGPWGQRNPPQRIDEWHEVVRHLARDIAALVPREEPQGFKVGNEYNNKASFTGSKQDYFGFYRETYRAIREVFPRVAVVPGEFTGKGICAAGNSHCVYDSGELLDFAREAGVMPAYVPRSLHGILAKPEQMPSEAVQRAVESYARLGSAIPEIHQFGLLGETFSSDLKLGSDQGARQAAWEFQVLFGLWETIKPRRVFHWNTFFRLEGTDVALLNGTGFVRLFLDRYLGAAAFRMNAVANSSPRTDVKAIAFRQPGRIAVVISSFTSGMGEEPVEVTARIPLRMLAQKIGQDWRKIRLNDTNSVYAEVRRDLAAADNLKQEFSACGTCVTQPTHMARDRARARSMMIRYWPKYREIMKSNLRWGKAGNVESMVSGDDLVITIQLAANEVAILEQDVAK